MTKQTDKLKLFVQEYVVDFNGKQAAIRAGYSERSAAEIAYENLRKPHVMADIEAAMQERLARTRVNADYVLQRLVEIDQMDVADILDDDGKAKPIQQWPKIWRQYIAGFDVSEQLDEGVIVGTIKKIKWPDKIKNIELIGKHISVGAFKDKLELDVTADLAGLLAERRKQARGDQ